MDFRVIVIVIRCKVANTRKFQTTQFHCAFMFILTSFESICVSVFFVLFCLYNTFHALKGLGCVSSSFSVYGYCFTVFIYVYVCILFAFSVCAYVCD